MHLKKKKVIKLKESDYPSSPFDVGKGKQSNFQPWKVGLGKEDSSVTCKRPLDHLYLFLEIRKQRTLKDFL